MAPSLFAAVALAVAAPGPKEARKDPPTLVGEWAVQAAVIGGKRDDPPAGTTWTFTADGKSVLTISGAAGGAAGMYTTDPKKDPARVDISAGPKGTPMKGVYKRDGDALTLCLGLDPDARPAGFESKAGDKVILLTLTKVKKKD
jgi:uncharacterized protein (TIGR03067 family)